MNSVGHREIVLCLIFDVGRQFALLFAPTKKPRPQGRPPWDSGVAFWPLVGPFGTAVARCRTLDSCYKVCAKWAP